MDIEKTVCNACGHVNRWHSYKMCSEKWQHDHNRLNYTTCPKCGSNDVKNVDDADTMGAYSALAYALFGGGEDGHKG